MATGIILAGGAGKRMTEDKAFIEVGGRRIIDVQLEVLSGLFGEVLIVGNRERMERLAVYERPGVRVIEEQVRGRGPLGAILSGLVTSGSEENFVLACDMPFVKREAVRFILGRLGGYQVAVPRTPGGLEPLHAAYTRDLVGPVAEELERGDLKVTGFYDGVCVNYIPWGELERFDPTGRLLMNINSPEDMEAAAGRDAG